MSERGRPFVLIEMATYSNETNGNYAYGVATAWGFRAAKLFRRLFEIVRSMIAPQLMHFQA